MYIVKEAHELYSQLNEKISMYLNKYDEKTLFKAFKYAYNKHWKQKTICGKPYIMHLLWTAVRLAELRTDFPSIVAAILHDVITDTWVDIKELKQKFWKVWQLCDMFQNMLKWQHKPKSGAHYLHPQSGIGLVSLTNCIRFH